MSERHTAVDFPDCRDCGLSWPCPTEQIRTITTYLASPEAEKALAEALQSTILTSPDEYMGPGQGAYRTPYADLKPNEQRHVGRDARAILAAWIEGMK